MRRAPSGQDPCSGREASGECRWWWPRRRVWGDTSVVWGAGPSPECRHSYRRAFYSTPFSYLFFRSKLTQDEVKLKGPVKRPGHWWRGKRALQVVKSFHEQHGLQPAPGNRTVPLLRQCVCLSDYFVYFIFPVCLALNLSSSVPTKCLACSIVWETNLHCKSDAYLTWQLTVGFIAILKTN